MPKDSDVSGQGKVGNQVFYIERLPVIAAWSVNLPNDSDFQKHAIEIPIQGLAAGFYVLLCTAEPTGNSAVASAYTTIFSTHLSYISGPGEQGGYYIFLPDRETGKPLKGVTAEAYTKNYDNNTRTYQTNKKGVYLSDENGMIRIPERQENERYERFFLKLRQKDEVFITRDLWQYSKPGHGGINWLQRTYFFTDRAIYRPGQIIDRRRSAGVVA